MLSTPGKSMLAAGPVVAWALLLTACSDPATFFARSKGEPKAHVTIYLDQPIMTEGGAIIVAGRPLPEAQWRQLKHAANPARDDRNNPKRGQVLAGDRHFGAVARSPVTFVELFYPDNGSYTFNLLPLPSVSKVRMHTLQSEEVLIGSADRICDPEGGYVDWKSLSVIAVTGSKRGRTFAYLANATASGALDRKTSVEHFEGLRTISLSPEQISRYVRD